MDRFEIPQAGKVIDIISAKPVLSTILLLCSLPTRSGHFRRNFWLFSFYTLVIVSVKKKITFVHLRVI